MSPQPQPDDYKLERYWADRDEWSLVSWGTWQEMNAAYRVVTIYVPYPFRVVRPDGSIDISTGGI
jgi:hypothetical protein